MEKTVVIFSSRDSMLVHHIANQLSNAEIENMIIGDIATSVFGVENITQEIRIKVFQSDVIPAKQVIEKIINKDEE